MGLLHQPELEPGPHRDLVDALHRLHDEAGRPSLRAIARRAGCSHTTVSPPLHAPTAARVVAPRDGRDGGRGRSGGLPGPLARRDGGRRPAPAPSRADHRRPPRRAPRRTPPPRGRRRAAGRHRASPASARRRCWPQRRSRCRRSWPGPAGCRSWPTRPSRSCPTCCAGSGSTTGVGGSARRWAAAPASWHRRCPGSCRRSGWRVATWRTASRPPASSRPSSPPLPRCPRSVRWRSCSRTCTAPIPARAASSSGTSSGAGASRSSPACAPASRRRPTRG